MTCVAPRRLTAEQCSTASAPEHHGSIPSTRPYVWYAHWKFLLNCWTSNFNNKLGRSTQEWIMYVTIHVKNLVGLKSCHFKSFHFKRRCEVDVPLWLPDDQGLLEISAMPCRHSNPPPAAQWSTQRSLLAIVKPKINCTLLLPAVWHGEGSSATHRPEQLGKLHWTFLKYTNCSWNAGSKGWKASARRWSVSGQQRYILKGEKKISPELPVIKWQSVMMWKCRCAPWILLIFNGNHLDDKSIFNNDGIFLPHGGKMRSY